MHVTAHDAAVAKGLIHCPLAHALSTNRVIVDSKSSPSPNSMRKAFVELLINGCLTYPRDIWMSFGNEFFGDDRNEAVYHIEDLLAEHGYILHDFNLPR